MKPRIVVGVLVVLVSVSIPAGASAKGARSVMITGPGLDTPIRISNDGGTVSPNELASVTGFFGASSNGAESATRPPGDLGPRYVASYRWLVGPDTTVPIRQRLYPFAEGGAVAYTRPGQQLAGTSTTVGGWHRSGAALTELLVSAGVPASGRTEEADLKQVRYLGSLS